MHLQRHGDVEKRVLKKGLQDLLSLILKSIQAQKRMLLGMFHVARAPEKPRRGPTTFYIDSSPSRA